MSDKKETTTYAVKLDVETKEELLHLIETESDGTAGDFIEVLINTYKANKLANTVINTKSELRELNALTSRIYNLYNNLIERNEIALNNIKTDFQEKITDKEEIIKELKLQLDGLKSQNESIYNELNMLKKRHSELQKERDALQSRAEKDNKLIMRLEEDVIELKRIKKLNEELSTEINQLKSKIDEMNESNQSLHLVIETKNREIADLQSKIENLEINHKIKLEDIISKLELQKQQELFEIKNHYQKILNEKDNEIQSIKNEKIKIIEEQQDKYLKRIEKLENDKIELENKIKKLNKTNNLEEMIEHLK